MPQASDLPSPRPLRRGTPTSDAFKKAQRRFHQSVASIKFIANRGPRRGLVFHHIPKCAGSSVGSALFSQYTPWQYQEIKTIDTVEAVCFINDKESFKRQHVPAFDDPLWVDIHRHRLRMLYTILSNGTKAVRGHVVYDEALHRRFENSHDFITILRDPIERFVSQYFYNKHVSRSRLSATFDDAELERVGPLWGSMMTFFLSGGPRSGALTVDVEDEQRVADAKEAVEALNVVGFVDRMEVFQRQLAAVTGLKLSVGRRNVRSSKDESEEERWIREAAPRFCAPDLEVYEHARAIWSTKS